MTEGRLLLISNSTVHGRGYLDHVEGEVRDALAGVSSALFVPYALFDRDAYYAKARDRFKLMGLEMTSIHRVPHPRRAVEDCAALFIGGGNTFRLLHALLENDLIGAMRARVNAGLPYIGSSAGAIVAGPTIKTTKDMPIVHPVTFDSLGIFRFQVSPHYLDPDPASTHMGETQEERILQFLEESSTPVTGLREGSWIRVEKGFAQLRGPHTARFFRRGHAPEEVPSGTDLYKLYARAATRHP